MNKQCGHGKLWEDDCLHCKQVSMNQKLKWFMDDCDGVIKQFEDNPGLTTDPRVIPGLYSSLKRLATCIIEQDNKRTGKIIVEHEEDAE